MGRLAIDSEYQRQGLGQILLFDAFVRTVASEIATFAFLVDAKDDSAEAFYRHYGFQALPPPGRRLLLPVAEIANCLLN
jgi:ribosomal protein S18 acetylase RimI-like enzyme